MESNTIEKQPTTAASAPKEFRGRINREDGDAAEGFIDGFCRNAGCCGPISVFNDLDANGR